MIGEVDEQRDVVLHYLCRKGNYLLCGERAVRPYFQRELVVVGILSDAGVFHIVVDLFDGRIYGIYGDVVDELGAGVIRTPISAAAADSYFHIYLAACIHGADVLVAVDYLSFGVLRDIACLYLAGTFLVEVNYLYIVLVGYFCFDSQRL